MSKIKKREPFKLLGNSISPGKTQRLSLEIAKLHTNTPIQIQVIVSHAKKPGPVLLLLGGIHGDELNGVEIIRRSIRTGINKPDKGTVICIPVFNIFGFLNLSRQFPDGRDLNRMFPGSKNGSLASQFAYVFMTEIAPLVDVVLDFHTGGAQRYNFPQVRCDFSEKKTLDLCKVFGAPFVVNSKVISKSLRNSMAKIGKLYVIFEGGKAHQIDDFVVETALEGIQRVMTSLGLRKFPIGPPKESHVINQSKWIRASRSGIFNLKIENGVHVAKGTLLATISDPYGKLERSIKATMSGFVFNVNETPLVNKGDALFNIGKAINYVAPPVV